MLSLRQQETIENLKIKGITTPDDIIRYCLLKIPQPNKITYVKHPNAKRVPRRRHSKKYYYEIIDYYTNHEATGD